MNTENAVQTEHGLPMVRPGERALLLSHHEYREARALGRGLESYDILMRRPDEADAPDGARPGSTHGATPGSILGSTPGSTLGSTLEAARWQRIPADKYLKHRANGWREAESLDELPDQWIEAALERDAFREERPQPEGGE